jgi:hypothetical protein
LDSIRVNRDPTSNKTDKSDWQSIKHPEQRISQLRGITIERSEENENAFDSIRVNRDPTSNETDKSDLHPEKHPEQRIWQLRGITIE